MPRVHRGSQRTGRSQVDRWEVSGRRVEGGGARRPDLPAARPSLLGEEAGGGPPAPPPPTTRHPAAR